MSAHSTKYPYLIADLSMLAPKQIIMVIGLGWLISSLSCIADIYKEVDEHGNVIFSDKAGKKSREVDLRPPQTYKKQQYQLPYELRPGVKREEPPEKPINYQNLAIIYPVEDESIRANSGDITIQFSISPAPSSQHTAWLYLDGEPLQRLGSRQNSVDLTNLDRGSHTVSVRIHDEKGRTYQAGDQVTFHLQRFFKRKNS